MKDFTVPLNITLIQDRFQVGDLVANADTIIQQSILAHENGADLVVFPELALVGYPPEDLLHRESFIRQAQQQCLRIQTALKNTIGDTGVIFGLPVVHDSGSAVHAGGFDHGHPEHRLYNAAVYVQNGIIHDFYFKQSLPNYSVFDELRYFRAGTNSRVINHHGYRIGLLICEDVWRDDIVAAAVSAGARALVVINASPYHVEKHHERIAMLQAGASRHGVPIMYLNMIGGQDELVFDGDSLVVDQDAQLIVRGQLFEQDIIELALEQTSAGYTIRSTQKQRPPSIQELYGSDAVTYKALVTGVRDFVQQNGFSGVVIGLSGGVDSALTLAIAVDALGADNVEAVMMPSRYTANISLQDAEAEADMLGVKYHVITIEQVFGSFLDSLAPVFQGLPADTTEENLQARCRGVLLMAISNKMGRMVLTTGNKSEMAVGYATLYGDMCGGFAPIKDVCKTRVYQLCHYRNSISEVIPQRVLTRPPSAELRENQTDQDSLPDYDILDRILELSVEKDAPVDEIVSQGIDRNTVERVIRLVQLNEYKRRQSAPGIRITRRAFGRDRRYPITSGYRRKRK
jgi:NAD+ synthase (glutamine-hydrolysing)